MFVSQRVENEKITENERTIRHMENKTHEYENVQCLPSLKNALFLYSFYSWQYSCLILGRKLQSFAFFRMPSLFKPSHIFRLRVFCAQYPKQPQQKKIQIFCFSLTFIFDFLHNSFVLGYFFLLRWEGAWHERYFEKRFRFLLLLWSFGNSMHIQGISVQCSEKNW